MMFHSYCDPLVYKANRVAHLEFDDLPTLSDKDHVKRLVDKSYKVRSDRLLVPYLRIGLFVRNVVCGPVAEQE